MTFDAWIQDEFPGGVDDERAEDMRLAWDAALKHGRVERVPWELTRAALDKPPTPLTPCIGVPVIPARDDTNKTSDLSGNVRKPGASAGDRDYFGRGIHRIHPARDDEEEARS